MRKRLAYYRFDPLRQVSHCNDSSACSRYTFKWIDCALSILRILDQFLLVLLRFHLASSAHLDICAIAHNLLLSRPYLVWLEAFSIRRKKYARRKSVRWWCERLWKSILGEGCLGARCDYEDLVVLERRHYVNRKSSCWEESMRIGD